MDWTSVAIWAGMLAGLRAGTTDFAMRPERWETRAAIPVVESVLRDPLSGPAAIDVLGESVSKADGSAGLLAAGFKSLGVEPAAPAPVPLLASVPDLPPELAAAVAKLVARLTAAQTDLKIAVDSLSPAERAQALSAAESAVGDTPFSTPRGEDFAVAARFDLSRLAAAGLSAAGGVDEALPALRTNARGDGAAFSTRFESAIGIVIVSSGDATLDAEDLSHAGLIVRLGGRTHYQGPAASASEGQIRVVVDLGGPAVLESSGSAAGAGDFGVGLLYILGAGPHSADVGGRSLGAARFGVGYAAINGDGTKLASRRLGQGAAAFGVGALDTRGDGTTLTQPLAGQGYGTARGAGIWRHRGANLNATCGYEVPDAREALGSVSMGQGAGMGPRAYAAGGVGVAHVTGADAHLMGSYFSQGTGYWHGLGALFIQGDGAKIQARRYSLGTGVHAGVGALDIKGAHADLKAWGVGPGFAWDYGVGLFRLRGDDASLRSDWAVGRGDLGGRALTWIEGDRNRLQLNDEGTGSYSRGEAGYGLAVIKGRGNKYRAGGLTAPLVLTDADWSKNPWGAVRAVGDLTLDTALTLPDPVWPATERSARAAAEAAQTAQLLSPPPAASARERLARILFAAAADILDTRPAQGSALSLSALDESDAPALASLLDTDRFDELIWARLAAAGLGPAAARAAAAESVHATGVRRAMLLDWLRFGHAAEALPVLEEAQKSPDWRERRAAGGVISSLFDDEGGDEPGRRRVLRAGAAGNSSPETIGRRHLSDLDSALALAGAPTPQERIELLSKSGSPFDAVAADAINAYAVMVSSHPERKAAMAREEKETKALVERARADLRAAAADPDDEAASGALLGLGGLGFKADAPVLLAALSSPSGLRREAASVGLSRLGENGRSAIKSALSDLEPRTRALGALAAAQTWDVETFTLLKGALSDRAVLVRAAALSGLNANQAITAPAKIKLLPELTRLAKDDPDPGVRASATLAAAAIAPAKTP
jgi:hypothetical protein